MKFERHYNLVGADPFWIATRQKTPVENRWLESRGFDPNRYSPLPDDKDGKMKEYRENMQRISDYIASLPDEEADKVIKDIEDKLGIGYRGVLYGY